MFEHEEVEVLIRGKIRGIDKNMVSIIKWLNHIGAQTLYCCEGYSNRKIHRCGAYVMFVVEDLKLLDSLLTTLQTISNYGWGELKCDRNIDIHSLPRFTLYLASIDVRNKLTKIAEEYLKQQGIQCESYLLQQSVA